MAEKERFLSTPGQELTLNDVDAISEIASRASDRTLSEVFRPAPNNTGGGAQISKGIVPFSFYGSPATDANFGIVAPSGSADGSVLVTPFRAVLGSTASGNSDDNWRAGASAVFTGSDATKKTFQRLALPATSSNNRWDLIYAKLTLGSITLVEDRYIRDPSTGTVTLATGVNVEEADVVTVGRVGGTEAATPTRPSLPSDSGSDYYFPLAYVRLVHPHTAGTTLLSRQIQEVAPTIPMARATGAATLQPGNSQYETSKTVISNGGDFTSSARPNAFLPSTMVGQESRFFAFDWDATTKTHPVSATTLIDDTIDWRRRVFKWWLMAADGTAGDKFVWNGTATDNIPASTVANSNKDYGFGQSFIDDGTGTSGIAGGVAAIAQVGALASTVYVQVNLTDGKLYVVVGSDPSARLFLWIEASGPFSNK